MNGERTEKNVHVTMETGMMIETSNDETGNCYAWMYRTNKPLGRTVLTWSRMICKSLTRYGFMLKMRSAGILLDFWVQNP